VRGKVFALNDLASPFAGIVWDSSSGCSTIPGPAVCYSTGATSIVNGSNLALPSPGGNTYLIYQTLTTTYGLNPSTYAAGLCSNYSIQGYNDWYLPSICEMGYDALSKGSGCGTQLTPLIQNIISNLKDNGIIPSVAGTYWSSTKYINTSGDPQFDYLDAWYMFYSGSTGEQDFFNKWIPQGVRCSREFTN